jgi:hypothetical protein
MERKMDTKEAAFALHESEYRKEGSRELFDRMKAAGLVAVFGASDDLMEMRGAVDDEFYDDVHFTRAGVLRSKCEDDCPYFLAEQKNSTVIEMRWDAEDSGGIAWTYRTDIPHVTFDVLEDGDIYCRGIVFALADVPA